MSVLFKYSGSLACILANKIETMQLSSDKFICYIIYNSNPLERIRYICISLNSGNSLSPLDFQAYMAHLLHVKPGALISTLYSSIFNFTVKEFILKSGDGAHFCFTNTPESK